MDTSNSYIDQYTPPSNSSQTQPTQSSSSGDVDSNMDVQLDEIEEIIAGKGARADQAQGVAKSASSSKTADSSAPNSEKLEDQNIFYMLGVTDGSQEEREAFLDELQQVIWEDFLDSDVKLLLTDQEMSGLNSIMGKDFENSQRQQEEVINYIEKFVPDLEDIMYEKALELKEDMVRERIQGMRDYYEQRSDKIAEIDQAEDLIRKSMWYSAATTLNSITD